MIFVALVVPFRIALIDKETPAWLRLYNIIDVCFGIDILLSFNTSYIEKDSLTEIRDHKSIVINYLQGWFFIDLISVIPFDKIPYQTTNGIK